MKLSEEVLKSREKKIKAIFEYKNNLEDFDHDDQNNEKVFRKLDNIIKEILKKVEEESKKGRFKITVDLDLDIGLIGDLEVYNYMDMLFKNKANLYFDEKTKNFKIEIILEVPKRLRCDL